MTLRGFLAARARLGALELRLYPKPDWAEILVVLGSVCLETGGTACGRSPGRGINALSLAETLLRDRKTVSRRLADMAAFGYVERDARGLWHPTALGLEVLELHRAVIAAELKGRDLVQEGGADAPGEPRTPDRAGGDGGLW